MRAIETFEDILLYSPFVDMRYQINGLAAIVEREMGVSPDETRLFVFTHRKKRILKMLYWNGSGFALWMTKLEKQTFRWPRIGQESFRLEPRELRLLLDGLDIVQSKPHEKLEYSAFY